MIGKLCIFLLFIIPVYGYSTEESKQPPYTASDRIDFFRQRIDRDPNSFIDHNELAKIYISRARETGDNGYFNMAEQLLERSYELNSRNYETMLYLALVNSAKHNFQKAIELSLQAVGTEPGLSYAYGVLGDSYLESGEIDKARASYDTMHELKPGLETYSRLSRIEFITGDTDAAISKMKKAYEAGQRQLLPAENMAWAQVMTGLLYFGKGDLNRAMGNYQKSLEIMDNYFLALEHIAEIEAMRGNLEEAIGIYHRVIDISPDPEFLIALSDIYEETGDSRNSEKYEIMARKRLEQSVERGDILYLRPLAEYYADRGVELDTALNLAKRDMQYRSDIYAYSTLAWMHHLNGNSKEAVKAADMAVMHGTKDSELLYRAGVIYFDSGDYSRAEKYLRLALDNNSYFDPGAVKHAEEILGSIGATAGK